MYVKHVRFAKNITFCCWFHGTNKLYPPKSPHCWALASLHIHISRCAVPLTKETLYKQMEGRKNSTNISDWKRVCRVVGSTQIMASPAPGVAACIGLHVSIWPSSKFSTEGNSWTDQHWLNKRAPDLVSGHPPRILEAMKVLHTSFSPSLPICGLAVQFRHQTGHQLILSQFYIVQVK